MSQPPAPPPKIGVSNGWHWFTGALGMVRRYPAVFLPMGLIVGCIDTIIPLIGPLIVLFLGPAFLAGICVAAYTVTEGHPPAIRQLFAMFQLPEQRREAFKLCVPLILGKLAASLMVAFVVIHQLAKQDIKATTLRHQHKLLAFLGSDAIRPWLLVALAIVLFAWTLAALAIPRVALSSRPAYAAMGESFRAVWRHLAAWIAAIVPFFACLLVIALLLELTGIALIMELGLYTFLYAVLGPLLYLAWRELGGTPAPRDAGPPAPSSKPPSPPPPSAVLEA